MVISRKGHLAGGTWPRTGVTLAKTWVQDDRRLPLFRLSRVADDAGSS